MFWPFIEIDGELTYCPLADFGTQSLREGKDIYGKAVIAQPLTAHLPLHNAAQISGKIAVVERGQCDFVTKVRHAQAAGAIAVLVANTSRENPEEAFVMDAGRHSNDEIACTVRIPAMMVCYRKAMFLYEQLRECYLDRRELSVTIKFLGAQTSSYVLEQIEHAARQREAQQHEAQQQHEREKHQREAAQLLRKRLGKKKASETVEPSPQHSASIGSPSASPSPSTSSASSISSSSGLDATSVEMYERPPLAPPPFLDHAIDTLSLASVTSSKSEVFDTRSMHSLQSQPVKMTNHWCPITTSLLIMDVQNYFALPQNEKCVEQLQSHASGSSIEFYKRIKSLVVPNIQDVLLACRACDGLEIVYSVVESATRDGRERSRAHKHAGVHVPKGGFGAQVLARVAPSDADIVIPRTGVNIFESTNADYVLRNLGVTHLVVLGISMMKSIQQCAQTALDRGYQVTLVKDAIVTGDNSEQLDEMLHHCEKLGCQVVSASAFVGEIHGYADVNDNNADVPTMMASSGSGSGNDADHRSHTSKKDHSTMTSDLQIPTSIDMESQATDLSKEPVVAADAPAQDTDTDRIGGFVWKFPSEGSNSSPGEEVHGSATDSHSAAASSYPRKCRYCQSAWVSSYVNERRHWKQCNPEQAAVDNKPSTDAATTLGIPRRVWCEVDGTLTALQWREDVHSDQDTTLNRIPFREVVLETPSDAFQVTTLCGRRIVFQCRSSSQPTATTTKPQNVLDNEREQHQEPFSTEQKFPEPLAGVVRALDARQWSEYLQIFSRLTQDQEQTMDREGTELLAPEVQYECSDTHSEMLQAITRAIISKDVESLQELLADDDHEDLAATLALLDDNGSSLLVVAFKLGGDERIVRALVQAGVDCNRQNRDGETPLLLAAASGEMELLHVLLSIDKVDVNQKCAMGATAFHAAANAGEVDALRMLCEATDERKATNVHALDDNGWTALHYAAACASGLDAMCFLCELMPEFVDRQCSEGNTALHVAAGYGCAENARVLLQTAANPHVANSDGHTAYKVALQNHHIACAMAIHEYMATPRDYYERVAAVEFSQPTTTAKEDHVGQAEVTAAIPQRYRQRGQHDEATTIQEVDDSWTYDGAEPAWVEYTTEDQIPYYYNSVTGVSTWHKPVLSSTSNAQLPSAVALPPAAPFAASYLHHDGGHNKLLPDGHKLPLCMIPLVSPLISLDDPTAATKFDSRRRKDRERRRSKVQKKQQRHHTESYSESHALAQYHDLDVDQADVWPPPPPPPPL